jgi:hypothetical protein
VPYSFPRLLGEEGRFEFPCARPHRRRRRLLRLQLAHDEARCGEQTHTRRANPASASGREPVEPAAAAVNLAAADLPRLRAAALAALAQAAAAALALVATTLVAAARRARVQLHAHERRPFVGRC